MRAFQLLTVSVLALGAGLTLTACSSGSSPLGGSTDGDSISTQEMVAAQRMVDDVSQGVMDVGESSQRTAGTSEFSWNGSDDCPLGGSVSLDVMISTEWDTDIGLFASEFDGQAGADACAFQRGEFEYEVTGSSNLVASRRFLGGMADGPQTVSYSGEITVLRSDGETRTCSFDMTYTREPGVGLTLTSGGMCGDVVTDAP